MAKMTYSGADELALSMKEVAELPDRIANDMLQAKGKIVADAQKKKITATILNRPSSGVLAKSVKVSRMKTRKSGDERYVTVYPQGTHHTTSTGKKVSNNEVFFINEFGAPKRGIAAKGIARAANEESAPQANDAEFQIYDRFLKSKNL